MASAKKRVRIVCPESGSKILFPSYESAEVYIEGLRTRDRHPEKFQHTRIYYCQSCGGYHTTTSTKNRLERTSPKARSEALRLPHHRKYNTMKQARVALETKHKITRKITRKSAASSGSGTRTAVPGCIYRHFKGDYYQVLAIARHTDTREPLVIYQLLYHKKQKTWARPFKEFLSEVDHERYPSVKQKYRFELQKN